MIYGSNIVRHNKFGNEDFTLDFTSRHTVDILDDFDFESFLATEHEDSLDTSHWSFPSSETVSQMSSPLSPPPHSDGAPKPRITQYPKKPQVSSAEPMDVSNDGLEDLLAQSSKTPNKQDDVNITISRDTTSGSNFQKDKLLALNQSNPPSSRQVIDFPLPNDPLGSLPRGKEQDIANAQAYQSHLLQLERQSKQKLLEARQQGAPIQPAPHYSPQYGGVPASYPRPDWNTPYDYQQQLKLLEQANKQRLTGQHSSYRHDDPGCSTRMGHPLPMSHHGMMGASIDHPANYHTAYQLGPLPPLTSVKYEGNDNPKAGWSKKRAAPLVPDRKSDHVQRLLDRIKVLEGENEILKVSGTQSRKPPRYQIFYHIHGDTQTYLEPPTWYIGSDEAFYLKGHSPITSKSRYLHSHPDIVFCVEKTYSSSQLTEEDKKLIRQGGLPPTPKAESESIHLETDEMIDAVEEFFSQQPKSREEFPEIVNDICAPLQAPYLFWYRYASSATLAKLDTKHEELMRLLTEWIEDNYLEEYDSANALFDAGLVTKNIMKYFVAPGDVIVTKQHKNIEASLASGWCMPRPSSLVKENLGSFVQGESEANKLPLSKWAVFAWKYGFDGKLFSAHDLIDFELRSRDDDEGIKITDLKSYPLRFADEETREKLEKRGRTFWNCRKGKLVACHEEEYDDRAVLGASERYMIDYPTYKTLHPASPLNKPIVERAYVPTRIMKADEVPDAPKIYLFPRLIIGYNLRQKKWEELEVDRIRDIVWNKKAFEHLVVEPGIKELVQALVTNQISSEKNTDLIQNKGNGLVMLLHGGPGTGKTFTAESVAEMAEKPLFRVTCGDIGTEAESVEKYLESVLHLGRSWGCVVLLDEADVFLEQRTLNDLTRNALVSVFLRVLEYYDGILILTSNRVGTFDEAFKSRIQLALHYESLNRRQRSQIWTNFFDRLKSLGEKNIDYYDVEDYIDVLANHEMNGRQIRNAITTARQLAQFQGQDMGYIHLKHVITVASKFDRHLSSIQNGGLDDDGSVRDDETNISKFTWAKWKDFTVEEKGKEPESCTS